ncbi:MAG: hypothetical protein AM1032_000358 [Mycoplasmataceae bacterium]|nr:MAG: hypothetical protein AM1032_000358 [Mycoplasmataceae bacterium]
MVMFRNDFWFFVENSLKNHLWNNFEESYSENEKRERKEGSFGKWLLFFNWDEAWEQWKKVVIAIEDGSLYAPYAKISRRLEYTDRETAFICVYTYENNIDLVRKQLFDLGFKKLLCFKKNESK